MDQLTRSIIDYEQMKRVYTPMSPSARKNEMHECFVPKSSVPDTLRLASKTSQLPKQLHHYISSSPPSSPSIAPSSDRRFQSSAS